MEYLLQLGTSAVWGVFSSALLLYQPVNVLRLLVCSKHGNTAQAFLVLSLNASHICKDAQQCHMCFHVLQGGRSCRLIFPTCLTAILYSMKYPNVSRLGRWEEGKPLQSFLSFLEIPGNHLVKISQINPSTSSLENRTLYCFLQPDNWLLHIVLISHSLSGASYGTTFRPGYTQPPLSLMESRKGFPCCNSCFSLSLVSYSWPEESGSYVSLAEPYCLNQCYYFLQRETLVDMQFQQYLLVSADIINSFEKGCCLLQFHMEFQNFKDSFGEILLHCIQYNSIFSVPKLQN